MSLLSELQRLAEMRALDDALANTLYRIDPATPDEVLAAAALASRAVANGHAGFDIASPQAWVDAEIAWPEPDAWRNALAASHFVAVPDSAEDVARAAPLVFEHGLLYLRRYREYERRLAARLRRIAAQPMEGDIASVAELFARLFLLPPAGEGARRADEGVASNAHPHPNPLPPAGEGVNADDRQARAAALALRRALLLVTGGPGTGKTTTIARLLALRIAQAKHARTSLPRIALAAPTGRAADRMADSLRRATAQMIESGVDAGLLAALPQSASTLHRLLGPIPDSPRFRHDADNPLPFDIVVVDEASMVDLPLMCKLTEAVADGAQLVLLGDADQLPSVEAGDVLAAILAAAGPGDALAADDARALRPLLGDASVDADSNGLHGHRVHLTRGWRQGDALDLARLAEAVRAGDAQETLRLLRGGELSNVFFHENSGDPLQTRPQLLAHWRGLATLADPAEALRQANRLRLLTALREGPTGALGLNARIEAQLSGRRIGTPPAWFPGRLLLVVENSYRHELFNGDVGVCLADERGTPLAWFPGGDGVRAFHPAALPAHESAFAMTVHKAQGSEFDEVWLQLPRADSRVLSRELLYTGLTRARNALHVAGSAEVIEAALARHAGRVSGLGWRLG
jgi:exodeoxyribonuclease V alpha subunit